MGLLFHGLGHTVRAEMSPAAPMLGSCWEAGRVGAMAIQRHEEKVVLWLPAGGWIVFHCGQMFSPVQRGNQGHSSKKLGSDEVPMPATVMQQIFILTYFLCNQPFFVVILTF